MTPAHKAAPGGLAFRPSPEQLAQDRRRYDLALGIALAVGLGLAVTFTGSLLFGSPPTPRFLLAWAVLLGGAWLVIAGGMLLRRRERFAGAAALLALVAAPAAVIGIALLPFSLIAAAGALGNLTQFRDWAGETLTEHLPAWAVSLVFLGALLPAALVTRRFGRYMLGLGLALGAVAMISTLLLGMFGGFAVRGMR
jgi:hypothetical protein